MLVLATGDLHVPERAVDIPAKFKKLLQPRGKILQVLCTGNVTSPSSIQFLKSLSPDFQMVKGEQDKDLSLPLSLVFTYDKLKVGLIDGFEIVPKSDPLGLLAQARMMDVDILIYGSTHKVEAYTLDEKFFINPGSVTGAFNADSMDKEDLEIIESILKEEEEVLKKEEENDIKDDNDEKEDNDEKDDNGKKDDENDKKDDENDKNEKEEMKEKIPDNKEDAKGAKSDAVPEKSVGTEEGNVLVSVETDDENLDTTEIEPFLDPIPSFCLLDLQGSTCTLYLYTLIDGEVKVDKLTYRKGELS
ncbi:hypothetical protein FOA43_003827 [Brettanomyces nanus]|uniref:Vacuolar protein sorting-associated protein 29 n=1 Tax=Eeniella nana TaxID=13502 RepID=A0A875S670_EENNA|nr:uncharacterized protein FOA43_003827 [Brettanomyces nanus]QPG76438.1 hypothetical protein FOA43_003827 [Brettanomyces nanus]